MLPIVVAQTNLSPEISFPYRPNPCAWRPRFEPASRLTAAGCKATVARTSGTISTSAVADADPGVVVTSIRHPFAAALSAADASVVLLPAGPVQPTVPPAIGL